MGRLTPRERTGLLIGVLAMFLALDVAFLVSLVGLPFTPLALGQAIIDVLPGWIRVPLIELLHFWAKALLVVGVLALFLLAGGVAGMFAISSRRGDASVIATVAAPWIVAVVLGQLFAGEKIDLGTSVVDAAVGLVANALALAYLAPAALAREAEPMPSRRRILLGGAALAAVAALGGLSLSRALPIAGTRLGNLPSAARRLVQAVTLAPADPDIDALAGITPRITANEDHYTVDTTLVKPRVDIATWTLDVTGAVEAPFSLTYEELLDLDAIEQAHTLECISNATGGELIGTAVWTGARMRDLLQRARPAANAYDVVLTSVDGYVDSFPIAKAMEPETLLVYLMNGKTLPQDHGYPVRTLVPNIYGMKNVKWLRSIEVATFDKLGYWQEQGWSDGAIVNTGTRIDVPARTLRWDGGEVTIAGIAFAGSRGITKVEVSFDGARTWQTAKLEAAIGPLTWRRWSVRWTPPSAGTHTLQARATDGRGETETPVPRQPFPNGATGYHVLQVNVSR
ncbi:MAG TPA: molybdopterin-dependent oxidoreductase [Candidatus Limnocylindria bacterium]|nr:molybdopterin-dependent oxidoreductase [Candidatus Limnocylindria bacterium]